MYDIRSVYDMFCILQHMVYHMCYVVFQHLRHCAHLIPKTYAVTSRTLELILIGHSKVAPHLLLALGQLMITLTAATKVPSPSD